MICQQQTKKTLSGKFEIQMFENPFHKKKSRSGEPLLGFVYLFVYIPKYQNKSTWVEKRAEKRF